MIGAAVEEISQIGRLGTHQWSLCDRDGVMLSQIQI